MNLRGVSVYAGLSGGVDSALTAALLKEAGARVTGVFIKGWYPPGMPCTWATDRRDAMRVAAHLQIPFKTLDASEEYRTSVIDYLLAEYRAGRTPNPDIMCNRDVKFGAFYRFAKESGANYIATGHYARTDGAGGLARGVDPAKDQSYFLWAVPKEVLAQTLFPLGALTKERVRVHAKRRGLPVATKKDSQGICFLGSVSVEEFLQAEFGTARGDAFDDAGNLVGTHPGALLHTLGERVRLSEGAPGPWFVHAKNIEANTLIVGHTPKAISETVRAISYTNQNWFAAPSATSSCQTRYHGEDIAGTLDALGNFVPHVPPKEAAVPGQSIVFYDGERVVGGGIIAA